MPHSHHGDAKKVGFLCNVVVVNMRAAEPRNRISTHRLTFQQLYGKFEAASHLKRQARLTVLWGINMSAQKTLLCSAPVPLQNAMNCM